MKRIKGIIENKENIGKDFIVHVQNKEELEELAEILTETDFEIQFTFKEQTLKEWMEEIAEDDNYDTCFRIRNRQDDKCVTYNPSIEHWRKFCNDILEIKNGELVFHEGEYTIEESKIEAKKIWNEIHYSPEEGYKLYKLEFFNLKEDSTEEEIIKRLLDGKL